MSDVSRSVYQKVCEENKRLKADIRILAGVKRDSFYIKTVLKWRRIFLDEEYSGALLKKAALQYIKDHPEIKLPKL